MMNSKANLEVAIRHYIADNDELVQDMIREDASIRVGILNWLKEMEEATGEDIYGTASYLTIGQWMSEENCYDIIPEDEE